MIDKVTPRKVAPLFEPGLSSRSSVVFWMLAALLLISGCQSGQLPSPSTRQAPIQDKQPVKAEQSAAERRAQVLKQWLERADKALEDDRLLTPESDNAFERYQAVLYLDPENERARTGLQAIVLRYLDLARSAARRGALSQAREMLERAQLVDPGNILVEEMKAELNQARERWRQRGPLAERGDTYLLDPRRLSEKAPDLVQKLRQLAARLPETGEFVLIVARTDSEARWIYRQLQEAVPGYRVRGNIQLGSPPSIRLLPTD